MASPTPPPSVRTGPLVGYRVLDLADEKGQLAARLLGELGADVIKVEIPRRGDRTRAIGPFYKDQPGPETGLFWWAMNAGKRSVTCALQVEAGRALFHQLVAASDVVIETNEPGTHAPLGLDYATLSAVNPAIVVVSVTNWGQTGPYVDAKLRSNDLIASAMTGMMHFPPAPHDESGPVRTAMPQAVVQANVQAAIAAVTALYARGADGGPGQHVDVSLQEAAAYVGERTRDASADGYRRTFDASDGTVVTPPLGGLQGPEGTALVDWLEENGSGGDLATPLWRSRLSSTQPLDPGDRAIVEGVIARFCATHPHDWLIAEAQHRGAAWTPLHGVREVVESLHLAERGAWTTVTHEDIGESFVYPRSPWRIEGLEPADQVRAPHIGEHNDAVFGELLGIDEAELRRLRTRMVV